MTTLDRESLFYKLEKIRANVTKLRELGKLSYRTFLNDIEHTATAERLLQTAIEAMLDVGNHLIAVKGWLAPQEYRDVFLILQRNAVLPAKDAQRYVAMVGLRNRLVHAYDEIDYRQIHRLLRTELNDFDRYVRSILRYAKKM